MRDSIVVLHDQVRQAIHFCETELQGKDRWFDFIGDNDDLFIKVESLMVGNGIAHNVTSVQYLRKCGNTIEYTVVFNKVIDTETNAKKLFAALHNTLPIEVKQFISKSPELLNADGEHVPADVVSLRMKFRETVCECYEEVFDRNVFVNMTDDEVMILERAEELLIANLSGACN